MRKTMIAFALLLVGMTPGLLQAQSTPTTPPVQRFVVSGKVSALSVSGTALIAADAVAEVGISKDLSIREDNILISLPATSTTASTSAGTIGQVYLGGVEYQLAPLDNGPLSKTFLSPANGFSTYVFGQMGVARSSNQTLAESAGAGINWCSSVTVCVNVAEVAWIHGSIPNGIDATTGQPSFGNNSVRFSIGVSW